jgi:sortase A
MLAYNHEIFQNGQKDLDGKQAYESPAFRLKDYGLESEVYAVISIPILELEMPVYLGATGRHMSEGAALLSQTSIPIGGQNTNAVIAGHRGWRGASYFRYIDKLQPGDEVIITNLWEELHYAVTEIQIIQPNEVDKILIQPDRELVTLLTCHPYASGGRQRLLVICERIPYEPDTQIDHPKETQGI